MLAHTPRSLDMARPCLQRAPPRPRYRVPSFSFLLCVVTCLFREELWEVSLQRCFRHMDCTHNLIALVCGICNTSVVGALTPAQLRETAQRVWSYPHAFGRQHSISTSRLELICCVSCRFLTGEYIRLLGASKMRTRVVLSGPVSGCTYWGATSNKRGRSLVRNALTSVGREPHRCSAHVSAMSLVIACSSLAIVASTPQTRLCASGMADCECHRRVIAPSHALHQLCFKRMRPIRAVAGCHTLPAWLPLQSGRWATGNRQLSLACQCGPGQPRLQARICRLCSPLDPVP